MEGAVQRQHWDVETVGAVCVLTIVSWLGDVFQVLGYLLVTWVTLDKSFLFCPSFTFS